LCRCNDAGCSGVEQRCRRWCRSGAWSIHQRCQPEQ
jgi:hypothetical protein